MVNSWCQEPVVLEAELSPVVKRRTENARVHPGVPPIKRRVQVYDLLKGWQWMAVGLLSTLPDPLPRTAVQL